MKQRYLDDLATKIGLEKIRQSGLKILYDAMYGAGQGVVNMVLPDVGQIHETFNPAFGGVNPEPLEKNLGELMRRTKEGGFDIGIATDGDADRIGAVDENGNFVDSHRIFALLLKYLYEEKGLRGDVVKSFSVTQMIDKQAEKYHLPLFETPVGFKYIGRMMTERDVLIGGEESGGLGVKGHIPERDGIFLGLMLCEMMATRHKKLSELVEELMQEFGRHEFKRIDLHVTEKEKKDIMKRFQRGMKELAGYPVTGRKDTDGYKLFVDSGWVLVRASGTEPLVRFYAEADSTEKVDKLLQAAMGR